jgi:hypothetical protein
MDTNVPPPKDKPRFHVVILSFRIVASWRARIFAWWSRFIYWRTLESLEHLNDDALRDIGQWRDPGGRTDGWWRMNPPP